MGWLPVLVFLHVLRKVVGIPSKSHIMHMNIEYPKKKPKGLTALLVIFVREKNLYCADADNFAGVETARDLQALSHYDGQRGDRATA
jgi:hypothetical protein